MRLTDHNQISTHQTHIMTRSQLLDEQNQLADMVVDKKDFAVPQYYGLVLGALVDRRTAIQTALSREGHIQE